MCDCEFDPYPSGDLEHRQLSWHYRRTCVHCGHVWYGLHCPHDGQQNPCPLCGARPVTVPDLDP